MRSLLLELVVAGALLTAVTSGKSIIKEDGSTDESTSTENLSGPELASKMVVGTRVVRGNDWEWNNQDGGDGEQGTVYRGLVKGWVKVKWDAGESNSYRMGSDDKYDLKLAFPAAAPVSSPKLRLSGPELAALMTVGTRVVRGKDWEWGDQDGGVGGKGTVSRELINGYVKVKWDSGASDSYRMGSDGKYDLDLDDDSTSTNEVSSPKPRLSGPELAALMTAGTRVVRGKDWEWSNQDGGVGGKGTVSRGLINGYVKVKWDSGASDSYRMGNDGKYDLDLADESTTTNEEGVQAW